MTNPAEAIARLAAVGPGGAKRALLDADPNGLGRALFMEVTERLGRDPATARSLARLWRPVFRRAADPAYAIRVRAIGERLDCRWAKSAASFLEASRIADDPGEKLAMRVGSVDSLARAGQFEEAVRHGRDLSRRLVQCGDVAQAGRVALNVANALVWADRHRESGRWYQRALERLPVESRVERAAAMLGRAAALLLGDVGACVVLATSARDTFAELGLTHYANLSELTLAQAEAIGGRHDGARRRLLELRPAFEESSAEHARVEQFLGDAYRQLGLDAEAKDAYMAALASPALRSLPFNALIAEIGLGELARNAGDPMGARGHLLRAYRGARSKGNALWIAAAALALGEAALESGDLHGALGRGLEALGRLSFLTPGAFHIRARLLTAAARTRMGRTADADLQEARRILGRRRYVADEWRPYWLEAEGRRGPRRLTAYRRMFRAMLDERALRTSVAARQAYFGGKNEAVCAYLRELLARPTPTRIREAVDAIGSSRSVALVDEIVSARRDALPAGFLDELVVLRQRIAEATEESLDAEGARRAGNPAMLGALRRRWTECVERVLVGGRRSTGSGATTTFVLLGDDLYRIHQDRVSRSVGLRSELESSLRWLWFDLSVPHSSVERVWRRLEWLREHLPTGERVAPDGLLWSVPWGLLGAMEAREVEVAMHPSFGAGEPVIHREARVLVVVGSRDPLPHIEREVEDLRARFAGVTVCRTVAGLYEIGRAQEWDVLHVAGHAGLNPGNPMFSAIFLDDGPLLAADLATLGLRARFAFLDACETGRLSLQNRSEPDGLVRALLATGTTAVIANAWSVDDEAARVFARGFYDASLADEGLHVAMAAARRAVRERYPHPYFWGPFSLFAGYREEDIHA
ncbi:MAG: CHAT domain-containing protein [Fimbriimonadaceae bacterium]|nr:CHAT domain-containing protein [Fimbriimonadaceae bacterium]